MKPPTSARPCPALLLLLVLLAVAGEASAGHGRRGWYHHHQHQHEEHRAPRTRREQDQVAEVTTTGSGDGPPGTDAPIKKSLPCTKLEDCLELRSSICDKKIKVCRCPIHFPIKDEENMQCLKSIPLNHTCKFNIQCHDADEMSYCSEAGTCLCLKGYKMADLPNIGLNCAITKSRAINSAMIGVVAGLGLMFVIICVVLRLFSKRRGKTGASLSPQNPL